MFIAIFIVNIMLLVIEKFIGKILIKFIISNIIFNIEKTSETVEMKQRDVIFTTVE